MIFGRHKLLWLLCLSLACERGGKEANLGNDGGSHEPVSDNLKEAGVTPDSASNVPARGPAGIERSYWPRLFALSPAALPPPPADVSNAYADNPKAAELGRKLFFDTRFSGPLLDSDNDGAPGTLGHQGDVGVVSCESCHNAEFSFYDARSPRAQLSLASGWTRRRTPSLLDVGQARLVTWDGRRDTLFGQVFSVIESPLEFNSSRLFVAQQIHRFYKEEYQRVFGPLPSLDEYETIIPEEAGCAELPESPQPPGCPKPGDEDPDVIRIVVNFGKALGAYQRLLTCGPSRFDEWVHGDEGALTAEEMGGARIFLDVKCDDCHSGPYLSDQKFYNVGSANLQANFVLPYEDPGAAVGLSAARADILSSRGIYSDGDDGRLDLIPEDPSGLLGAFRTPTLRCVGRQPSFMHAAQKRSLEDVVSFFDRGGDSLGYLGEKDHLMVPLGLTSAERAQLTAFLRALDGDGPARRHREEPQLPQ